MSAAWQDGFIKANGLVIHFTRTGGNKPPVILNHGALDDGLCWTRVAKTLQEDYDLIMLDARGHGLSEIGHGDYSSVQRAADIAEVVRALGLNRPVIGGHSLGADAAMHLAAIYPDLPRAIFLEDPPVTFPGQPIFGGKLAEGKNPAKLMVAFMRTFRILPTFLGRIAAKKLMPTYPDDEINPWLASKKRCSRDFIKSMTTSPLHSLSGIPHKLLSQIKVPVLLFIGDREKGSIVSQEAAQEMEKSLREIRIVHLEGANHDIRRVRFDAYVQVLREFLEDCHS